MSQDLNEAAKPIKVADVERMGEKILIPDRMSFDDAIKCLMDRKAYEAQQVQVSASFEVFPWDGACALQTVLETKYGWAQSINTIKIIFGQKVEIPPSLIEIEVGVGKTKMITWGRFTVPGVDGYLDTAMAEKDGRAIFSIGGKVLRRDEATIQKLFDDVRAELVRSSIYRGKALRIRFTDDNGEAIGLPQPRFIDTSGVDTSMAIYPDDVQDQILTNLFTPITRAKDCIENGISLKRGILFAGPYGVGKTLASLVASKLAVDNGITFIHIPRAAELSSAIQFARQYQSPACVVFCEDIDRETDGERTVEMDDILNIIDGIDSKSQNIMVVLTTNHVDKINPAMLRPGRLDAVIEIVPPDARAVERLIRLYAGAALPRDEDLTNVGKELAGNIPATIAEVVKRAKLAELGMTQEGTRVEGLTSRSILIAAKTMATQVALMKRLMEPKAAEPTLDSALHEAFVKAGATNSDRIETIDRKVREIRERL